MNDVIGVPGFTDPVAGSQRAFRAVLDAMSSPGRVITIGEGLQPPAPLAPATAAVALTLIDQETSVSLDRGLRNAASWLAFHSGAPLAHEPERAQFVIAATCPALELLCAGTDETPETSATLILQIDKLGDGKAYRLSGPGLETFALLRAQGLPDGFASAWKANHRRYPLGIDAVLCAGARLAALPRSVALEPA
jgi:alpha-D-ribose 1-methylphosphonate 5-triphosphate synthase subunit PhnH